MPRISYSGTATARGRGKLKKKIIIVKNTLKKKLINHPHRCDPDTNVHNIVIKKIKLGQIQI